MSDESSSDDVGDSGVVGDDEMSESLSSDVSDLCGVGVGEDNGEYEGVIGECGGVIGEDACDGGCCPSGEGE